jgi:hypothetical protein
MVKQLVVSRTPSRQRLRIGAAVDVRCRFVGEWSEGFEVVERVEDGYRIRRLSDGSTLPDVFGFDDVRARSALAQWWPEPTPAS